MIKKYYYITTFIIFLIVGFIGITYSYEIDGDSQVEFNLIGPETLYMDVNTDYKEYGVLVKYNGKDISDKVKINDTQVITSKLGEYRVKYSIKINNIDEYIYRTVKVIDMSSPTIELIGGDSITILVNGSYYESGYKVSDNYDKNLEDKVVVKGYVDTQHEGIYKLEYTVSDSSNNKTSKTREVIVKKPIITLSNSTNGIAYKGVNAYNFSNTIIDSKFTDKGISISGYMADNASNYRIKIKNQSNKMEYLYNMGSYKSNYYKGEIDLSILPNGSYDVYIKGIKEEKLKNHQYVLNRIVRAKVGDKLITFVYNDDVVTILVQDFKYDYDIVIDPGHGGSEIGTANGLVSEKEINLKLSKYEMCRYESMGYKVYMTRYNDSLGEMLGDKTLDNLDRRSLTIGYYGAVSKVVYSNHHNGSYNKGAHGYEMIVGNYFSENDLSLIKNLANDYKKYYKINDDEVRIYSKGYDSLSKNDKSNNKIYDERDYYSAIRIPYELFNVRSVIYEAIYMSNSSDFNWYMNNNNYVNISELKIKRYVEYLGGNYDKDNSKCKKILHL